MRMTDKIITYAIIYCDYSTYLYVIDLHPNRQILFSYLLQ